MIPSILEPFQLTSTLPGAGAGDFMDCHGDLLRIDTPIWNRPIGEVKMAAPEDYEQVAAKAVEAFNIWRTVPAPKRGEVVRRIGDALRARKKELGALVSLEVGKIRAEGEGEVQEMIDIADFALGQSRMLYGLSMQSERPGHRMFEQWHPLGPMGLITAFNFPVAVWGWNAMLALIAGDPVIWKPSSKAPLSALAVMKTVWPVLKECGAPEGLLSIVIGRGSDVGETMIADKRLPLISATGSVAMGRHVGPIVAQRMGRSLLELGGNNAIVVAPSADLKLAVRAILFAAVGTAGQRCTTTRRIIVHYSMFDQLASALIKAYQQVRIGNPLEDGILMGPLIDADAVNAMKASLAKLKEQGGRILYGGDTLTRGIFQDGNYVTPCLAEAGADMPVVSEETFAPILYLIKYRTIEEAIAIHNKVPQGLSSAIFTTDLRESEYFLSAVGSDCGIANVNIGTSGAEIGGAFGGEKDTGGGRESGSDCWKAYMRRQTCTINYTRDLPLAQGIEFGS